MPLADQVAQLVVSIWFFIDVSQSAIPPLLDIVISSKYRVARIVRAVCGLLFSEPVLRPILSLQTKIIAPQFERAWGRYCLRQVVQAAPTAKIHGRITIAYPDRLRIGEHVRIGRGCYFFCLGGLAIGDNTQISRNVTIYTASHDYRGNAIPYDDQYVLKPVMIGQSVWIGMNVSIAPGVTIGDGAIVGMGTTVATDVPAGAVVVGAKARIVAGRDMKKFRLLSEQARLFGRLWPDL